jgi:membrane protease YdiL (CAAX protease family)
LRGVRKIIRDNQAVGTIFLAGIFWFIIFRWQIFNFWLAMSIAVTILSSLAILWGASPIRREDLNLKAVLKGIISAFLLYGIFYLGNVFSRLLFDFAGSQIVSIYGIRKEVATLPIFLVLFFITSPGEEIFWRGFLQRWAMDKYGRFKGFLLASLIYAAVHIVSGNFMLVMAALVAGLFWGLMYLMEENIVSLIISHALWTVGIFLFFPVA